MKRIFRISLKCQAIAGAAIIPLLALFSPAAKAESPRPPTGLRCDLLAHPEETVITTATPDFGWIYHPSFPNDAQTAYRIIVASSETLANHQKGDVWDSGLVPSVDSINVPYGGKPLQGNTDYYWRVQTVDSSGGKGPFSAIQHFHTDTKLTAAFHSPPNDPDGSSPGLYYDVSSNIWANRYPLRFVPAAPVLVTNTAPGQWFVDFGQDAFGYVAVHLNDSFPGAKVQARFGEMADGFAVNTNPPAMSMVRYATVDDTLPEGGGIFPLRPPPFPVYNPSRTIEPPESYGTVMPFRYFELINFPGTLTASDITQERLLDEFDTNAASFDSSSPALNQIWNLCRNSMEMLTFDGVYVDGDRERTPYEADAYINQMSAYAVNPEFTLPRYTFEYLLQHPTWPTEWKFHMIFIAWADYLQTGDTDLLYRFYNPLKSDLFTCPVTGDGLVKGYPDFSHKNNDSDVVDWPVGDRDGFVVREGHYTNWTNSLNNAFYYRSLRLMANIATVIGRTNDAADYTAMAEKVYRSYNKVLWDSHSQSYVDGVGTTHSSAHANFFPLAFGLVPPDRQTAVINYLHSRITADDGMPASVYGAQYFLEALFQSGDTDTALDLMTTNGPRGWLNMINMGSTLTTEAWSFADKPNLDWNHAWGAAPGNLISRFILGVRPVTPGCGQILIQPHLGRTLSYVRGRIPTIRGPVFVQVTNSPDLYQVTVNIPGNVTATVLLPASEKNAAAVVDGKIVSGNWSDGWLKVDGIGSGQHIISVNAPSQAQMDLEKRF